MIKPTVVLCGILLLCMAYYADAETTIELRDGSRVTGTVVRKDDTHVTIRTEKGERTFAWRRLTPESFRDTHPTLYEQMLARARGDRGDTGSSASSSDTQELSREDALHQKFRFVTLRVTPSEQPTAWRTIYRSTRGSYRERVRECNGVVRVVVDGLDINVSKKMRIDVTQHIAEIAGVGRETRTLNETRELTGNRRHEFEFTLGQYGQKRIDGQHANNRTEGNESRGFDIKIWLDDVLVYEWENTKDEQFYYVRRM